MGRVRDLVVVASAVAAMSTIGVPVGAQSPPPPLVVFDGSGVGGTSTDPFPLQSGDHRLAFTVVPPDGSADCGMGFALRATDQSYLGAIGANGATITGEEPDAGETWFLVPAAGEYLLDATGDCDWQATLTAESSPLDGGAPILIAGTGAQTSPSFVLPAGDHLLRYRATNPSTTEACIFSGPGIVRQGAYAQMMGDPIDEVVDPAATLEGELTVYGLAEGRYALSITYAWCSAGLDESIAWEVVIDPS